MNNKYNMKSFDFFRPLVCLKCDPFPFVAVTDSSVFLIALFLLVVVIVIFRLVFCRVLILILILISRRYRIKHIDNRDYILLVLT